MREMIIGTSPIMLSVTEALFRAAKYDKSVLLLGETGTGKDLAARKIHEMSPRKASPFIPINCSNLADGLFESELFGHARGAFTGAVHERSGLLDVARNGTVFMDEIGELPLHLQAKILRVLDKRESRRIGSNILTKIRVRFIFATNRDLLSDVIKGIFRKDLYYRINVVRIVLPALRERKGDIPVLAKYFLERENLRSRTNKHIAPAAMQRLLGYDFPGNVRELENIIERSVIFSEGNTILAEDIRLDTESGVRPREISSERLKTMLEECRWNKTKMALELGKSRRHLYRLLRKYGLNQYAKNIIICV